MSAQTIGDCDEKLRRIVFLEDINTQNEHQLK